MNENWKRGSELCPSDQAHVLRAYLYRNTQENLKRRPDCVKAAGSKLAPITDQKWLEITGFQVRKDGRLDGRRNHCFTHDSEVPEWKKAIEDWSKGGAK